PGAGPTRWGPSASFQAYLRSTCSAVSSRNGPRRRVLFPAPGGPAKIIACLLGSASTGRREGARGAWIAAVGAAGSRDSRTRYRRGPRRGVTRRRRLARRAPALVLRALGAGVWLARVVGCSARPGRPECPGG